MRISDWSSDVCSSDLGGGVDPRDTVVVFRRAAGRLVAQIVGTAAGMGFQIRPRRILAPQCAQQATQQHVFVDVGKVAGMKAMLVVHAARSEEHTSELQSLMRISYAVFCLKKKNEYTTRQHSGVIISDTH